LPSRRSRQAGSPHVAPNLPVGEPVVGGPARPPLRRRLDGRFVSLVPTDAEAHTPGLFASWKGSPGGEELWTYLPFGPFEDEAAMGEWVKWAETTPDFLYLTVIDRATEAPIGMASFMRVEREMRSIELGGIWYAPAAQRTQANTEATYLMLQESFDALGYRRVEWKCNALNERSREAALRLGFKFEGIFRQHMVVKGRNRDTAWFSMLDSEWPGVRANMERWLGSEPGTMSLSELNSTA
jgi:RimJ/RimL family protein N-acetyltransferase